MPGIVMLPFIMIKLCGYGLAAGLLRNAKIPTFGKVVIAQIAGRAVRTVAILAVALLCVLPGVHTVFAEVMSEDGIYTLARHGITPLYDTLCQRDPKPNEYGNVSYGRSRKRYCKTFRRFFCYQKQNYSDKIT